MEQAAIGAVKWWICLPFFAGICLAGRLAGDAWEQEPRGRLDPSRITILDQSPGEEAQLLALRIRSAFEEDSVASRYAQNLTIITTSDGRIVVRGVVSQDSHKARLDRIVARVAGNRPYSTELKVVAPARQ